MGVGLDFWPHQSSPPQATSLKQEIGLAFSGDRKKETFAQFVRYALSSLVVIAEGLFGILEAGSLTCVVQVGNQPFRLALC